MNYKSNLLKKINNKSAVIGIIGLGYVGLPLALTFAEKGFKVIGFDIDEKKIPILSKGKSYIKHIPNSRIKKSVISKKFDATFDFSRLTFCDCILICVPTPLNDNHEPDISFIENSGKTIAEYLQPGQLIVLESSTYPGTTEEVLLPLFANAHSSQSSVVSGQNLKNSNNQSLITDNEKKFSVGKTFFLAFSPEREDPGNKKYNTSTIPKVVGGFTQACLNVATELYSQAIKQVVPVSSCKVAESAKLLENIYRSVNIALVNELKIVFDKMGIDVWEVIEAAKTKPFGFQAFYPGPGLGGHCIPIDPFYLTWKAKEFGVETKFIELAGKINTQMPYYVVNKVVETLNVKGKTRQQAAGQARQSHSDAFGKRSGTHIVMPSAKTPAQNSGTKLAGQALNGSKILILGVSYKKNIDDLRESPALKLIEILKEKDAEVDYHDPYVSELPKTRKYNFKMKSIESSSLVSRLPSYDIVILTTDHDIFNYKLITKHSKLIIDTRNAFESRGIKSKNIHKA